MQIFVSFSLLSTHAFSLNMHEICAMNECNQKKGEILSSLNIIYNITEIVPSEQKLFNLRSVVNDIFRFSVHNLSCPPQRACPWLIVEYLSTFNTDFIVVRSKKNWGSLSCGTTGSLLGFQIKNCCLICVAVMRSLKSYGARCNDARPVIMRLNYVVYFTFRPLSIIKLSPLYLSDDILKWP